MPLAEFYTGFLATVVEPDELVVEIEVPTPAGKTVLLKHGRLYTNTPAIVSVAAHVIAQNGGPAKCASHSVRSARTAARPR